MADAHSEPGEDPAADLADRLRARGKSRGRRWPRVLALAGIALIIALTAVWLSRERLAGNAIEGLLGEHGIPATYTVEQISAGRQVLTDVVVGDPRAPDLTIERAEIAVRYRLGTPQIGQITLVRPRLYGTWRGGRPSFGSLDRVLFRDTGEPPRLPDLDVRILDGRALIESEWGPLGAKLDGAGRIDSGFAGVLAVAAPALDAAGCEARGASLYASLTTARGKPTIDGPLRLSRLDCAANGPVVRDAAAALEITLDSDLAGFEGQGRVATGALAAAGLRANGVSGSARAAWRSGMLTARYALAARGFAHPQVQLALLTAEGSVRGRDGWRRVDLQAELEGNGVRMGAELDGALAAAARGADGTLLAPLLRQARGALAREGRASSLVATLAARRAREATSLIVPEASLRGGSGQTLLSLSRAQLRIAGDRPPSFSGNLATGGMGLPRIVGRMERGPEGRSVLRLRMAPYAAGGSALAIPELILAQGRSGALGFSGRLVASGPLPGGSARNLTLPLSGAWNPGSALALWNRCIAVRFDQLALASLALERRGLTLCPRAGQSIVERDARGWRVAGGATALDLAGSLAGTPIRLRAGPVGFAYPGAMSARAVDVALGPPASASTFRISNLTATFGREVAGRFEDAHVRLFSVPLDLTDTTGAWRYAEGSLQIANTGFRLVDREGAARFNPLVADDGALDLRENVVRASATLREPATRREVTDVAIVHDLASGTGHADLTVTGLAFDRALQPDDLFARAKGVIANTRGVVRGSGRIEWTPRGVTSRGAFSSDDLDFAAAFGPIAGASGTVEFTDLLALTTAPGQRIRLGSINPGIEVTEGDFIFALREGEVLSVSGASWPFMGGRLTLRQVDLNLGASEERRYVFEVEGLEAAQFVERMELPNLSATGTFDGTVPIVFDRAGNGRVEGGLLIARAPGGNISYVGELTRENLGTMANFAFDALRSLDYRQMSVAMDGNLTGEIVTRVRFDGVEQGAGARRNFITRRFENLPIRFNVNVRAPFYQLITSLKAMYDPASVRDPRELGLLTDDGRVLRRVADPPSAPPPGPGSPAPAARPVQTSESEKKP